MMIICKECGAEISSLAKCCPRCGCPTKTKSKSATASLVLGIISMVYGLGSCVNDYFTENTQQTILPIIIIMGILSIIFGITAIIKTKTRKKSIAGIILGAVAILVSVMGHVFL